MFQTNIFIACAVFVKSYMHQHMHTVCIKSQLIHNYEPSYNFQR